MRTNPRDRPKTTSEELFEVGVKNVKRKKKEDSFVCSKWKD